MKRFALVAALLCTAFIASASPASGRYYYRRPVARAAVRVALPPYGRGYYGPRYYGPRYYGGYYGGYYGPRYYGYGPRYYGYGPRLGYYGPGAYVGIGVY
jgi:hypothetical protein